MIGLEETIRALAWALLHFLWQGVLIAIGLELALLFARKSRVELRYAMRCGALLLMGAAPGVTFWALRTAERPATDDILHLLASDPLAASVVLDGDPWLTAIVGLWSAGVIVLWTRLLRNYLRVRRLQRSGVGTDLPAEWQARFDALASGMGVKAVARVIESAVLSVPTVIGWLRPVVLIPARVLTGLTTEQVEALIAHELMHVRRHDFAVNLVQSALEALLFYHPAVWWVSKGIRTEREYCCDDAALSATTDRVSYARALTTLESWRGAQLETGMSTLGGSFMQRIQRTIGIRPAGRRRGPLSAIGALAVVAVLGATAFGHSVPAGLVRQDPDQMREIRARLSEIQRQIDDLRALLDGTGSDLQEAEAERKHERERGRLHERERDDRDEREWLHQREREHRHEAERLHREERDRENRDVRVRRRGHEREEGHDFGHDLHERLRGALEGLGFHPRDVEVRVHDDGDLREDGDRSITIQGLDTGKLHEHLREMVHGLGIHEGHGDGERAGKIRGLDAEKLHQHLKKALGQVGIRARHKDGGIEISGLPDLGKAHEHLRKALGDAGIHDDVRELLQDLGIEGHVRGFLNAVGGGDSGEGRRHRREIRLHEDFPKILKDVLRSVHHRRSDDGTHEIRIDGDLHEKIRKAIEGSGLRERELEEHDVRRRRGAIEGKDEDEASQARQIV